MISPTSAGIPNLDDIIPNAVATIKKTRMASVNNYMKMYESLSKVANRKIMCISCAHKHSNIKIYNTHRYLHTLHEQPYHEHHHDYHENDAFHYHDYSHDSFPPHF